MTSPDDSAAAKGETPRTKAIAACISRFSHEDGETYYAIRDAALADVENLERELTAAQAELAAERKRADDAVQWAHSCSQNPAVWAALQTRAETAERRLAEIERAELPKEPCASVPGVYWQYAKALRTYALRVTAEAQADKVRRLDLSNYVNAAHINGNDCPHTVVQKLQSVIDAEIAKAKT